MGQIKSADDIILQYIVPFYECCKKIRNGHLFVR